MNCRIWTWNMWIKIHNKSSIFQLYELCSSTLNILPIKGCVNHYAWFYNDGFTYSSVCVKTARRTESMDQ